MDIIHLQMKGSCKPFFIQNYGSLRITYLKIYCRLSSFVLQISFRLTTIMNLSYLNRIDRAVADNLKDIERSFGNQAGIVQDFIVFISRKLRVDLFGFTRFTLQEFCKETGRRRQELALLHPDFISGKRKSPEIQGYLFNTVFDYALYSMMERNIIFSSKYEIKNSGQVIQMYNFPILKEVKLNFERNSNEQKIYDVRLSNELLSGFLTRYYTVDSEAYKLIGKGRGGEGRKRLLIYLSKLNHVLLSTGASNQTTIPIDRLCEFAGIDDPKPSHKKQNLTRVLDYIIDKGKCSFQYEYIGSGKVSYMVNLVFSPTTDKITLQKEHSFYFRLMEGLKSFFDTKKNKAEIELDKDPFQQWLSNGMTDTLMKSQILVHAYYAAFNKNIPIGIASNIVISGNFIGGLLNVNS